MFLLTRGVALDGQPRRDAPSASACNRLTGEEGKRLAGPTHLTDCPLSQRFTANPTTTCNTIANNLICRFK